MDTLALRGRLKLLRRGSGKHTGRDWKMARHRGLQVTLGGRVRSAHLPWRHTVSRSRLRIGTPIDVGAWGIAPMDGCRSSVALVQSEGRAPEPLQGGRLAKPSSFPRGGHGPPTLKGQEQAL